MQYEGKIARHRAAVLLWVTSVALAMLFANRPAAADQSDPGIIARGAGTTIIHGGTGPAGGFLAHAGEALAARQAFDASTPYEKDCLIEFLKTLQVLPPGTHDVVVNEEFTKKASPQDPP